MRRQAELRQLILAHGVRVILAPNYETPKRGEAYTQCALDGLTQLPVDENYRALVEIPG